MNRTIYFPLSPFCCCWLCCFCSVTSSVVFSAPRSMLQSGKAIDRTAEDKATLINPHAVGLFPETVEIRVLPNDRPVDSSVDSAINKVTRTLRRVQRHLKDREHAPFDVKIVSRHRSTAYLATRIHSWLVGEFGHAYTTNGRPRKENRINGRRLKKQVTTPRLVAAGFKAHGQN